MGVYRYRAILSDRECIVECRYIIPIERGHAAVKYIYLYCKGRPRICVNARATHLITAIRAHWYNLCIGSTRPYCNQLIRGIKHTWSEQINCDCSGVLWPAVLVVSILYIHVHPNSQRARESNMRRIKIEKERQETIGNTI